MIEPLIETKNEPGMSPHLNRARRDRASQAGFSIIEATIGIVILVVAASGLLSSLVGSAQVSSFSRETSVAQLGARGALDALRVTQFSDVFATFNGSTADDPGGVGTAVGVGFPVPGLDPIAGDVDGLPGRIIFPFQAGDPDTMLREDQVDPSFSLPRDLNGDGVVDAADHSGDYKLLPVRVIVEWRGSRGVERSIAFETLITSR
jgi:type II secretory pathway pseudopilin PulG